MAVEASVYRAAGSNGLAEQSSGGDATLVVDRHHRYARVVVARVERVPRRRRCGLIEHCSTMPGAGAAIRTGLRTKAKLGDFPVEI